MNRGVSVALKVGAFAVLWWTLTGGAWGSWLVGLPAIAVAALVACGGARPLPWIRWKSVPGFVLFLLHRSIAGSIDVAKRALSSEGAGRVTWFEYELRATSGVLVLSSLVTVLPGTLVVRVEGGKMLVHALADEVASRREIRELEDRLIELLARSPALRRQ